MKISLRTTKRVAQIHIIRYNRTLTARVELALIDNSQHGDNLDTLKQQYTSELLAGNIVRKLIVKQNSLFNEL
jgi:hypothetical protein